jgi:spermidine synthase
MEWNWFIEYTTEHHGTMYVIKENLFGGETPFQKVDIIDTYTYGRILIINGKSQSAEHDEHMYHEALIHPAANMHPDPKSVMIMGGGEGAVVRELCRYRGIEEIVMVDIDSKVVEMCREHLPEWSAGAFDDSRVELLHEDARKYLEETDRKFDIIYSDLSEPVEDSPSRMLFTRECYEIVKSRLNPGGIVAVQAGDLSPNYLNVHAAIRNTLGLCFKSVRSYHNFVPSFNCAWSYLIASDKKDRLYVSGKDIDKRLEPVASGLKFYDGVTHEGMFCLPKDIRKALDDDKTIIVDNELLEI